MSHIFPVLIRRDIKHVPISNHNTLCKRGQGQVYTRKNKQEATKDETNSNPSHELEVLEGEDVISAYVDLPIAIKK